MTFNFKILLFKDGVHIGYIIEEENDELDDEIENTDYIDEQSVVYDIDTDKRSVLLIVKKDTPVFCQLYNRWKQNIKKKVKKQFGDYERMDFDPQEIYEVFDDFHDKMIENNGVIDEVCLPLDEVDMINDMLSMMCYECNLKTSDN